MVGLALVLPAAFAFASVIIKHMYTVVLFVGLGGFYLRCNSARTASDLQILCLAIAKLREFLFYQPSSFSF